ncbi:hypothetical protein [Spirosoma agri]|uniref:Uncharacterized protein n=1 Tax=Spirosoma agri TaxID=1987381 RepID=A0A6M0IT85_9BACT|nr:hypothetical protein [Spirosoma agri]NEU70393.1 hypothetical protein [Spirosoma agri]
MLALSNALHAPANPIGIETIAVRLLEEYLGITQIQFGQMIGQEVIIHRAMAAISHSEKIRFAP